MYITRTDLEEAMSLSELTQLSQDDPLLANKEPDWAIVDRAIEYACEMADGYLQGRYTLPLAPTPSILRVGSLPHRQLRNCNRRAIVEIARSLPHRQLRKSTLY